MEPADVVYSSNSRMEYRPHDPQARMLALLARLWEAPPTHAVLQALEQAALHGDVL